MDETIGRWVGWLASEIRGREVDWVRMVKTPAARDAARFGDMVGDGLLQLGGTRWVAVRRLASRERIDALDRRRSRRRAGSAESFRFPAAGRGGRMPRNGG